MGYTHYFQQVKDIPEDEWTTIAEDIAEILKFTEHVQGVSIRDGLGEPRSKPVIDTKLIAFNGCGPDDDHETFMINRVRTKEEWQGEDRRGWSFTKTARKPYDIAVTACLCYLATVAETHEVSTDGHGSDWVAGLELARQALPKCANILDIPMGVMKSDRWTSPWLQTKTERYHASACVDGHAYVVDNLLGRSYRFETPADLKTWADGFVEPQCKVYSRWASGGWSYEGGKSIFDAWGSFDEKRHDRLRKAQERACRALIASATGDHALPPPAFVRPGEMPVVGQPLPTLAELVEANRG